MTGEQTPLQIARDFADGTAEAWSGRVAGYWQLYLREMLCGRPTPSHAPTVALRLRLRCGQLVIIRPKRLGNG